MIVMKCPGCQTRFEFADDLGGKKIRCKSCGDIFRVETPKSAASPKSGRHPAATPSPKSGRHPAAEPSPKSGRHPAAEPSPKSGRHPAMPSRRDDDDDDRPPVKSRRDDDDRPPVHSRRRDEDDDRPRSRRRDEDEDDDRDDRRSRRDDDSVDDLPRRKGLHPLLIAGPIVGLLVLTVVVVLLVRGGGKKRGTGDGEIAKGVSKTMTLDVPAKEIGQLVVPDGGNQFGILRNDGPEAFRKKWIYEPYDLAAGRRVGKVDLPDVKEPVAVTVSPGGKYLLVTEKKGSGDRAGDHSLTVYQIADGKCLTPQKWQPFPEDRRHDAPALFRAEFVGPDRILALGTNRDYHLFKLPGFEVEKSDRVANKGEPLGRVFGPTPKDREQIDWQVAFSADRTRWTVWNGDGYSVLDADGVEQFRTPSVLQMAQVAWPNEPFLDTHLRGGGVAFSPDGKTLAGFVNNWIGQRERMLCLWDATAENLPEPIRMTQAVHNEASGLKWWGNRYLVLTGLNADFREVDPIALDTKTGLLRKQLMTPEFKKAAFARDGRLWYAVSEPREEAARLLVVDPPDPSMMEEGDGQYEEIKDLRGSFLKRLWMEPTGVLKKFTRYNPPLTSGLVRQP